MGLWNAFLDLVTFGARSAVPIESRTGFDNFELKAATVVNQTAPLINRGNRFAWNDEEVASFIRESMRVAGIIFRGGTMIADAFAEAPLKVYEEKGGKPEESVNHWARQLISEPNPEQGEAEFWNAVILVAFTNGYCYIEKVRSRSGDVIQLYPRTPDTLRRIQRSNGTIVYEQRINGEKVREIPAEDIYPVPYQYDSQLKRLGVTPVEVIGREIGIDVTLTSYLKKFLDESGIPPYVIVTKDEIVDSAKIDQVQGLYSQKYANGGAWGVPPIFHGGWDIKTVGLDMNAMAWPDLRGVGELRIAQGLGIPPHLLGAKEAIQNGGLSTTEMLQAMRFFQIYTINQIRKRIAPAFTRSLLRERESNILVKFRFDTSEVEAMQEDEDKRHTRVRANVSAGLVTVEEARPELGYEPEPNNGEMYLRPFSVVEVTAGQSQDPKQTSSPPAKSERRYRDTKSLSARDLQIRSTVVGRNRKAQQKLTEIGDRALRKFWKAQGDRIVSGLKSIDDLEFKLEIDDIDWDSEEKMLTDLMLRFYETAGVQAFSDASAQLGVSIDWSLANPNVQRIRDQLAKNIVGIHQTTVDDVARIVADSLDEGVTLEQLADRLTDQFEETYRGRAMTVARTESQVAYNTASALGYQESGVVDECELADNPDHDTDPGSDGLTCAERNGLVVPLSDVQKHIDAEHPNGSLAVLPVVTLGED